MNHNHQWKKLKIKGIVFGSNSQQLKCKCGLTKNMILPLHSFQKVDEK